MCWDEACRQKYVDTGGTGGYLLSSDEENC